MAKEFVKIEFVENGISVRTKLEDISMFDKVVLLNGMMDALDINMDDPAECGMLCAMAASLANKGRTKIDMGAIGAAAERMKGGEDADGEGA